MGKKLSKDVASMRDQLHLPDPTGSSGAQSAEMLTHLKAKRPTFCTLTSVGHWPQASSGERVSYVPR